VLVSGERPSIHRGLAVAVALLALTFAAVAAPVAGAETYVVNSTADEVDGTGGCKTAASACTLRAAIEESNNSAEEDKVAFAAAFDGKTGDTITLTLGNVVIEEPVVVAGSEGERCDTSAAVKGPCVEVTGAGLTVESSEVTIRGLAVTNASTGISVPLEGEEFVARNDWIGVKLDGTAKGNNRGILIGPGSNGAVIGGAESEAQRNVIGNNNIEGLDIDGASLVSVQGNYFGVAPNGTTRAANNKDIEVTDSTVPSHLAVGTEIGGVISGSNLTSIPCDGACNVISGAGSQGIDLQGNGSGEGEAPASGQTTIRGNYIGLNGPGNGALGNEEIGINVGAASDVAIGGPVNGEQNHINGGEYGVLGGALGTGADNLEIENNLIGLIVTGTSTLQPPSEAGIYVSSEGISSLAAAANISGNFISMLSGTGILQHSVGATIAENEVFGGLFGIRTFGFVGAQGNTIEDNIVDNATENALLLENDANTVVGNTIENTTGAGIHVGPLILTGPASGNLIGGDTEASENTIKGAGGDAIAIVGEESIQNEVRRNHGSGNGGLFIELTENSNGEIAPPSLETVTQTQATGVAGPGATVRVFRKAGVSLGELQSFLGQAVADGSGHWQVTYGSIPAGTNVAATQTTAASGTSEVAFTAASASESGGGGGGGGGNGGGPGGGKDTTPPQTTITKGPPKKTHKTTVKFKFSSSEAGSTFECKLDRKPFKKCRSPKTYKKLKPGKHLFKVRAIDKAGNVDPTPAKRKFTVLK
jgi:CSLREA domain-containing protein